MSKLQWDLGRCRCGCGCGCSFRFKAHGGSLTSSAVCTGSVSRASQTDVCQIEENHLADGGLRE